jgi:hypothetical protein
LCIEQGIITSKRQIRPTDEDESHEYEQNMLQKGLFKPEEEAELAPNPDNGTRLQLTNLCRKKMDESTLMETLAGITHIVWKIDQKSGNILGQA